MKTLFWICVVFLVGGVMTMGFSEGHYEGFHQGRWASYFRFQEFAQATDLDAYLKRRGQTQEFGRLSLYPMNGPPSEAEIYRTARRYEAIGFAFVVMGLFGLLFTRRAFGNRGFFWSGP